MQSFLINWFPPNSLRYFFFVFFNNVKIQSFYRHKVLNNQEIKLIQGNSNLNRNCIMLTESVDHFSTI